MRKLVAVMIAGVAVVVIAVYFARSPSDTVTPAAVAPEHQPAQVPKHDVTADVTDTLPQPPGRQPQMPKHDLGDPADTRAQDPSAAPKNSARAAAPLTAEEQQRADCRALSERRLTREKAARDAEPKDPAWAYPMEQKLREYLTQQLRSGQLEVIGIDCKTTFCEIKALVLDPEGSIEFNKAVSDVNQESWNDFTGRGTSASEEAGKTIYSGLLTRPLFNEARQPAAEAQAESACLARVIEKQKRERAARDAQPKDMTWAEPMEQLLRQHLTMQMVKQPVERIDIDCRTTFCKIDAKGRTSDAYLVFQKVAQAVAGEPWANLRNGEGGGSSYGESWEQHYMLYRQ